MSFYARTELQIIEQPQSNTSIKYGQAVTLSVSATGAENLVYLWMKDGQDLTNDHYTGTNTPTLTISTFLPDDQGRYYCAIKNCNSTIESEQADLKLGMFIFIAHYKMNNNDIVLNMHACMSQHRRLFWPVSQIDI